MTTIHDSNGIGIGEENPLAVRQIQSDIIIPVDVQKRYTETIQTHNAVSVPANGWTTGSWIDTDGFDIVAVTVLNDASANNRVILQWSNDGITLHGEDETTIPSASSQRRSGDSLTRSRYFRLNIWNGDGALAHIMSAWAYLKA